MIFEDRPDGNGIQFSGDILVEDLELVAVISIQPIAGGKPQKTPAVLPHAPQVVVGEAVFNRDMFELQPRVQAGLGKDSAC